MKNIYLENKAMRARLEVRIFKDSISFFILPRKNSKYWIPVTTTKEEYKEIKKAINSRKEA